MDLEQPEKTMYIRKGKKEDLERLSELFSDARKYMAENGNPDQWKDNWPPMELIEEDIETGHNYVCVDNDTVVGTFFLGTKKDPTYAKIYDGQWIDDTRKYVVIHRITTDRNTRGVGSFCLNWAFENYGNVRIDTHKDNIPMQGLIKSQGFSYCGIIYLENGEERIAFQKC